MGVYLLRAEQYIFCIDVGNVIKHERIKTKTGQASEN